MEKIPLLALLLHSFPEAILFGISGVCLVGIRPRFTQAIIFGVLITISAYLIRQIPAPLGLHTVGYNLAAMVFLILLYRINVQKALAAAFIPSALIIVTELAVLLLILPLTNISLDLILAPENALLRVLIALPQMAVLAITAYIAYRVRDGKLIDSIAAAKPNTAQI